MMADGAAAARPHGARGFEAVSRRYEDIAETLGATPSRVFFTISLPLAIRSIVAGALGVLARDRREFGATIMVAGAIPGRTRTLVAIFTLTEAATIAAR